MKNFKRASASLQEFLKDAAKEVLSRWEDRGGVVEHPPFNRLTLTATDEGMQMQVEGASQRYQIAGIVPDAAAGAEALQFVAARRDVPVLGFPGDGTGSRQSKIIITGGSSPSSRRRGDSSASLPEEREAA